MEIKVKSVRVNKSGDFIRNTSVFYDIDSSLRLVRNLIMDNNCNKVVLEYLK